MSQPDENDAVCEALARLKSQADAMTNHGQNMQRYDIEVSVPLLHSADVMHKCYEELVAALAPSETRVIPPEVGDDS